MELLFYDSMLSNQGDFTVDPEQWPSGLAAAGAQIEAAGLKVGLHMIATGAQTCHAQPGCYTGCVPGGPGWSAGCANSTVERPDVFVPQGLAPRDWCVLCIRQLWLTAGTPSSEVALVTPAHGARRYWAQTRGTFYCHQMQGDRCADQTRGSGQCNYDGQPGCSGHKSGLSFPTSSNTVQLLVITCSNLLTCSNHHLQ